VRSCIRQLLFAHHNRCDFGHPAECVVSSDIDRSNISSSFFRHLLLDSFLNHLPLSRAGVNDHTCLVQALAFFPDGVLLFEGFLTFPNLMAWMAGMAVVAVVALATFTALTAGVALMARIFASGYRLPSRARCILDERHRSIASHWHRLEAVPDVGTSLDQQRCMV